VATTVPETTVVVTTTPEVTTTVVDTTTTVPEVVTTTTPDPTTTSEIPTTTVDDGICYEDEPCFDCATMGNLMCGPPTQVNRTLPETGNETLYTAMIAGGLLLGGGGALKLARRK
jgi:LPXTG-motif cell wall-anchored protein